VHYASYSLLLSSSLSAQNILSLLTESLVQHPESRYGLSICAASVRCSHTRDHSRFHFVKSVLDELIWGETLSPTKVLEVSSAAGRRSDHFLSVMTSSPEYFVNQERRPSLVVLKALWGTHYFVVLPASEGFRSGLRFRNFKRRAGKPFSLR